MAIVRRGAGKKRRSLIRRTAPTPVNPTPHSRTATQRPNPPELADLEPIELFQAGPAPAETPDLVDETPAVEETEPEDTEPPAVVEEVQEEEVTETEEPVEESTPTSRDSAVLSAVAVNPGSTKAELSSAVGDLPPFQKFTESDKLEAAVYQSLTRLKNLNQVEASGPTKARVWNLSETE